MSVYLLFSALFRIFSLKRKRHHCRWMAAKLWLLIRSCSLRLSSSDGRRRGRGLFLSDCQKLWGSLVCHDYWDTGKSVFRVRRMRDICTCCRAFGSGTVNTLNCFNFLFISVLQSEFENPIWTLHLRHSLSSDLNYKTLVKRKINNAYIVTSLVYLRE